MELQLIWDRSRVMYNKLLYVTKLVTVVTFRAHINLHSKKYTFKKVYLNKYSKGVANAVGA